MRNKTRNVDRIIKIDFEGMWDTSGINDKFNTEYFSQYEKQNTFYRMEELRKISANYQLGELDEEREIAIEEKFGKLI